MWPGHSGYSSSASNPNSPAPWTYNNVAPSSTYTQYPLPNNHPSGHAPQLTSPVFGRSSYSGTFAPPPGPPPFGHAGYQAPPGPPPIPPSGRQSYRLQQVPGEQAQTGYFQYSQCNGRKKALLIGINYIGQPEQLRGCIQDVHRMKQFLLGRGYKAEDIVVLTDDSSHPRQRPTRQNMIDGMHWLVKNARPSDSLFFHYSGHGGQTEDLDGDEEDGYDEVIYPVDFKMTSHIVDDDMHKIMVSVLPVGCRLTAIFDACHSGSALDLPYTYSREGKLKEPNMSIGAAKGLFSTIGSFQRRDVGGVIHGVSDLLHVASGSSQKAYEYTKATRTSAADVISWSGCKDSQTSADTDIGGRSVGAMSDAFLTVLARNPNPSYLQLLQEMRWILSEKYSQKPQFSSSHPIDTNLRFIV